MRVNAIFLAQPLVDGVTPWCWPHQAVDVIESAKTLAVIDHFGIARPNILGSGAELQRASPPHAKKIDGGQMSPHFLKG